jgi:hypothetical protein
MATELELAWAAGIFEGEGCIYWWRGKNTQGRRVCIALKVHMTDQDIVERFHAVVGCGHITTRNKALPHHKDQWVWQAGSFRDVRRVFASLGPWFGERRRAKMLEALEAYENQGPKLKRRLKPRLSENQLSL